MRRVGILTFHNTLNYGATLQCYALQEALRVLGLDVEVIDYRCEAIERSECQTCSPANPTSVLKYLAKAPLRHAFTGFRGRLALSARCDAQTLPSVARAYDCIVVGSDQVWNPTITHGDESYFLSFEDDPARCKSYAASLGGATLAFDPYGAHLNHFSSLLVRERSGLEEIRRLLPDRADAQVVADPTLLLDRQSWEAIARTPKCVRNRKYVLLYAISEFEESARAARELAQREGCEVIQICQRRRGRAKGARHLRHASPEEFVGLFAHASATVVSSFHGLCLSLAFEKDVYCTVPTRSVGASRLTDLLDELGQPTRVLTPHTSLDTIAPMDYELARKRLESLRATSLNALATSLGLGHAKGK